MVVPSGPYIPQMVAKDLLRADRPVARAQLHEPRRRSTPTSRSIPATSTRCARTSARPAGSTTTPSSRRRSRRGRDFIKAAQNEGSGQTSVLEAAPDLCGIYFWANGIDWNTEDPAAARRLRGRHRQPAGARTSRRSTRIPASSWPRGTTCCRRSSTATPARACSRSTIPSATRGASARRRASCGWTTGASSRAPRTVDAAYNFLNFILTPENSATDLAFHGYDTGITGVRELLPEGHQVPRHGVPHARDAEDARDR